MNVLDKKVGSPVYRDLSLPTYLENIFDFDGNSLTSVTPTTSSTTAKSSTASNHQDLLIRAMREILSTLVKEQLLFADFSHNNVRSSETIIGDDAMSSSSTPAASASLSRRVVLKESTTVHELGTVLCDTACIEWERMELDIIRTIERKITMLGDGCAEEMNVMDELLTQRGKDGTEQPNKAVAQRRKIQQWFQRWLMRCLWTIHFTTIHLQ